MFSDPGIMVAKSALGAIGITVTTAIIGLVEDGQNAEVLPATLNTRTAELDLCDAPRLIALDTADCVSKQDSVPASEKTMLPGLLHSSTAADRGQ